MTARPPTPPSLVEVVSAESIDSVLAEVATELAVLEEQVAHLDATAAEFERHVREIGGTIQDDVCVGPLLRQVFERQTAEARATMAAALDEAVRMADERVAAARAESDSMFADDVWCDERDLGTSPVDPTPTVDPGHGTGWEQASTAAAPTTVRPPHPVTGAVPADVPTTVMPAFAADGPRPVDLTDDANAAFGEFWVNEQEAAPARGTPSGIVDAILPLVAVLIIVIVLLRWIR